MHGVIFTTAAKLCSPLSGRDFGEGLPGAGVALLTTASVADAPLPDVSPSKAVCRTEKRVRKHTGRGGCRRAHRRRTERTILSQTKERAKNILRSRVPPSNKSASEAAKPQAQDAAIKNSVRMSQKFYWQTGGAGGGLRPPANKPPIICRA